MKNVKSMVFKRIYFRFCSLYKIIKVRTEQYSIFIKQNKQISWSNVCVLAKQTMEVLSNHPLYNVAVSSSSHQIDVPIDAMNCQEDGKSLSAIIYKAALTKCKWVLGKIKNSFLSSL